MLRPEVPIPIITIGGFLGAGKTTLVNHLLSQSDGQRIVVFVNDFGAINIDYDLIETTDTDRFSLANGCVCCSLNDDLIGSIVEFCAEDPPDAFVVEASGVADPRALDQSIATLQTAGHVRAAGRVYVVDLDQFGGLDYADTEQIVDHAVASDIVILNKADLASDAQVVEIETLLQRSSPYTALLRAEFCRVPLSVLISEEHREISKDQDHTPSTSSSISDYESWSCERFAPFSRTGFNTLMKDLCGKAFRAKGVIYFEDAPRTPVQIDFVGNRSFQRVLNRGDRDRSSAFVAIGHRDKFSAKCVSRHFSILE